MLSTRRQIRWSLCALALVVGLGASYTAIARGSVTTRPRVAHTTRPHHRTAARRRRRTRHGEYRAGLLTARRLRRPHARTRSTTLTSSNGVPQLQVDGRTLSWSAVPGADGYVFVEKVPGRPDSYKDIQGTSATPAPVPGKMVWFSVRANIAGSAWAPETAIDYPALRGNIKGLRSSESIGSLPFQVGLVAGSDLDTQLPYLVALGATTARLEFSIDTPASEVARVSREYAQAGIRPLLLASFYGRLPTAAEARNLGAWAAAVGPGGSAWNGHPAPNGAAVTDIEFGNETDYTYQFSDNSPAALAARARTYALRARAAAVAIRNADRRVGLLAIADTGNQGSTWISSMFHAVPNLGSLVAGWTVHPYGSSWDSSVQATISMTRAAGAPANVPVWITEWGLSSDGGSCVAGGNYGFSACLSYRQAATTLQSTLRQMRSRFGSHVAAFYLFQASDQRPLGATNSNQAYFGALQSNGSPKGNFTAAVEADLSNS